MGCDFAALLPGAVTNLVVDEANSNSVIVVWQPPYDNDNEERNDVRGYRLFYKEAESPHYNSVGL